MTIPDIIVGRDRAHVRTLIQEFPCTEVLSASDFFDKVRILAFLSDSKLIRDDFAPLIFAERILLENPHYPLWLSSNFSSLYGACYHGTSSPIEVFQEVKKSNYQLFLVFEILLKIDIAMKEKGLVTKVSALYHAWNIIKNNKILPPAFKRKPLILLRHLVDLTLLEIEIIKDLSRLGVNFVISFPLDFQKRGINVAVDFSALQFEKSEDLTNIDLSFDNIAQSGPLLPLVEALFKDHQSISLSHENCSVTEASDMLHEASQIASKIALILEKSPQDKVAIAVRSIDNRSLIYKHTLLRYGINVKDRKGIPLLESQAFLMLETIFSARIWSLPKRDIIGLINHPFFSLYIEDDNKRAGLVKLINDIGIDNRLIPMATNPLERYFSKLEAFSLTLSEIDELNYLKEWLAKIGHILLLMKERDQLLGHLNATLLVIEKIFNKDDLSILELKKAVSYLCQSRAFDTEDPEFSFNDFVSLLRAELSLITIAPKDNEDLGAVEFLPLPELLGRSFDHVFIADMSFGHMPQNIKQDPLIDDQARIALNKIVKKPLLRVYFDDPFEPLPVPPRQALEPFWFASALASSRASVHFSYASEDDNGALQAPSEFFIWLKDNIKFIDCASLTSEFISKEHLRFLQGLAEKHDEHVKNDYKKALIERNNAFHSEKTDDFAFSFHVLEILKVFDKRLGQNPHKALTPTMVEAFADCRFKGFSERILNIQKKNLDNEDIDSKALGQIAHRALELFFENKSLGKKSNSEKLKNVLAQASKEFTNNNYVSNISVFSCHIEWLHDALFSVIEHMLKVLKTARSVAEELAFGVQNSKFLPLNIKVNNRSYLLGGRIDRVMKNDDNFLIIDYKLSSTSTLMAELALKGISTRYFQMPIYLRLVAKHLANDDYGKVSFSFVSIRDGIMLPIISLNNRSIFERIFDDKHEYGLAHGIDRIFAPIMQGEIIATTGEHCTRCDMSYFCRKSEHEKHG